MSVRCPKCGSNNVIGYMGEWECMVCGYKFVLAEKTVTEAEGNTKATSPSYDSLQFYNFNLVKNGGKWFKGTLIDLILWYKPKIIEGFFPNCLLSRESIYGIYVRDHMGRFPKGKQLVSPCQAIKSIQRGGYLLEKYLSRSQSFLLM